MIAYKKVAEKVEEVLSKLDLKIHNVHVSELRHAPDDILVCCVFRSVEPVEVDNFLMRDYKSLDFADNELACLFAGMYALKNAK